MSLINLQSAYSPSIVCQKIIGLWCYPHENLYKLLKFLVLLGLTVDSTALITYVIFNFGSKNVADTIYSLPASVEVILKSVLYRRNFHLVRACLDNLQKREFQPQNTAQLKILTDAVSLSQRVFYSFFGLCFLVFLMWVFVPLTKEEWALPTHYWVPFEYKRNGLYQMIYFLQCLAFVFHAMSNVSLDTFFAISMILIGAQCDVLGDTIRNMGRFDGSDGKKDLKECVHHYRLIKEYASSISDSYKGILMVQFSCSGLMLCVSLYELSLSVPASDHFFQVLIFQMAVANEILLYCWFGNEVIIKSERLFYALFESKWHESSEKYKKSLIIFGHQIEKPVSLLVCNIFPVDLRTFVGLCQKSMSFFVAMRNIHEIQENKIDLD